MSCSFLLSSGSHNASPALAYLFPDFFCLCCFASCYLTDVQCVCVLTVTPSYIMETLLGTHWKSDYGVGVGPKVTAYSEHWEAKCRNSTKVINGKESLGCVLSISELSLFPNGKEQFSPCKFIWIGSHQQYIWASLVAQIIKTLPAMQETHVWSLGWEDPLEKGVATHSSILAWRIP